VRLQIKRKPWDRGPRSKWQLIFRRCKAAALLLLLVWLQALPAFCSTAKIGMTCCGGKICSAMHHRGSRAICHPEAKTSSQDTVDCAMDCCRSTTQAIVVSATFVLPAKAGLAFQLIADFLVPRSSVDFSAYEQVPDIPPPRIFIC